MIYALCRILVKCRDLRIFPGKKFRFPGTKNYYAALHIGEFFQGGFFSLEVVTFFETLRADLEDYFKMYDLNGDTMRKLTSGAF